jgi:hypothetical protein
VLVKFEGNTITQRASVNNSEGPVWCGQSCRQEGVAVLVQTL